MNKQDAVTQIISIMQSQQISIDDIANALPTQTTAQDKNIGVMRVLGYLGGLFVLAGISIFVSMHWGDLSSLIRVMITLGSGFACYLAGIKTSYSKSMLSFSAPLFIVAAILQSSGLFIYLYEYFGPSNHPELGGLMVFGVLLVQYFFTFLGRKQLVLLFFAMTFGTLFIYCFFDWVQFKDSFSSMIVGLILLTTTMLLENTSFKTSNPFWFLISSLMFLGGLFCYVQSTPYESITLLVSCLVMYVSIWAHSRILLLISTLSIFSYIAYFTSQYFIDSIGWPLALIGLGLILFGLSIVAFKINKSYILPS